MGGCCRLILFGVSIARWGLFKVLWKVLGDGCWVYGDCADIRKERKGKGGKGEGEGRQRILRRKLGDSGRFLRFSIVWLSNHQGLKVWVGLPIIGSTQLRWWLLFYFAIQQHLHSAQHPFSYPRRSLIYFTQVETHDLDSRSRWRNLWGNCLWNLHRNCIEPMIMEVACLFILGAMTANGRRSVPQFLSSHWRTGSIQSLHSSIFVAFNSFLTFDTHCLSGVIIYPRSKSIMFRV